MQREQPVTPETDAVQAQVDAYNAGDLKWFVACYAEDALIVDGDGRVIAQGHDEIRQAYAPRLARGVQVDIVYRTQMGTFVIDEERVTGVREHVVRAVAVYKISDGRIVHVTLLRDF